jgi:hypothetical protein
MTPLETKIWDMVSNWAQKQYYPINDFAIRALMDEILELVNEGSKDEQIKKLVEHYKRKSEPTNYGLNFCFKTTLVSAEEIITKLEKIINNGKDN